MIMSFYHDIISICVCIKEDFISVMNAMTVYSCGERPNAQLIIVSLDKYPRKLNGIDVIPATDFLNRLWSGQII